MKYETIHVEHHDNVATLTLSRPEAANAINLAMATELADAAARFDADPTVRAVVITGAGRFFSAGGDLKEFDDAGPEMPVHLRAVASRLHAAVACLHRMDAPVITAVNGTAAGGGFSLAIAGDLVVACASAKFTMGYSSIGLSPDGTATYFLPRLVGMRRAQELALTDRMLGAAEALQWGLVTTVFDDEVFGRRVGELALRIAQGPTRAYGTTKRLLTTTFGHGLETQAEFETRAIARMAGSSDGREGVAAFVRKRAPKFEGR